MHSETYSKDQIGSPRATESLGKLGISDGASWLQNGQTRNKVSLLGFCRFWGYQRSPTRRDIGSSLLSFRKTDRVAQTMSGTHFQELLISPDCTDLAGGSLVYVSHITSHSSWKPISCPLGLRTVGLE